MKKSSADRAPVDPKDLKRLAALEDRLRHENLQADERCELADHVVRLRRRLGL